MKKSNLFFDLLKYGITGVKPNLQVEDISTQEITDILNIAKVHEVLPIVVDAIKFWFLFCPKATKVFKETNLVVLSKTFYVRFIDV